MDESVRLFVEECDLLQVCFTDRGNFVLLIPLSFRRVYKS